MSESSKRFSWRKEAPTSRYHGQHLFSLRYGGAVVAYAQGGGDSWFWYSFGRDIPNINTAGNPRPLAEVKAEAVKTIRAALRANPQPLS
jgi:hypothetical protein